MPTKTVVMTNTAYKKYNPDSQEFEFTPLTANEFHQMAGRAGRRGVDNIGNVILYNLKAIPEKFKNEELTVLQNLLQVHRIQDRCNLPAIRLHLKRNHMLCIHKPSRTPTLLFRTCQQLRRT